MNIVYQKNNIEIYHITGIIHENSKLEWYDLERKLSRDNVLNDDAYNNAEKHMPEEEYDRFTKYLWYPHLIPEIYMDDTFRQFFILTYCPSNIDTFSQNSPRSVVSILRKIGNTIIIDTLSLTIQGLLWELHGGDKNDMNPRYQRARKNSTEPMFEEFFIYMLKTYPELKYGVVTPSDGTLTLLETWFDVYSVDSDNFDELTKEHGEIDYMHENTAFFLRTPYFEKLIHEKKRRIDIQCQICNQHAMFQCGNYCGKLYCNRTCAKNDWIKHAAICFASLKIKNKIA